MSRSAVADDEDAPFPTLSLPVAWVGVEDLSIPYVNTFYGQAYKDEVWLTFGTLVPPALEGTGHELEEQAARLGVVPIKPVARIAMNPARLEELRQHIVKLQKIVADQARLEAAAARRTAKKSTTRKTAGKGR